MKTKLFPFIFFYSILLVSCNKEEQQTIASETSDIKVYNQSVEDYNEIEASDSIRLKLKNNYKLCVVSQYDSIAAIYDEKDMIVEKTDNDIYLCKPQSEGAIDILFLGYNDESGTKILSIREIHFKVIGYYENYYITENTYTVEISDSDVTKYKILQQLQKEYLPQEEGLFHFYYTGLKRGDFTYIKSGQSAITGTFTVNDNDFWLDYNGAELAFSMTQLEDGYYSIQQDLTEKFQAIYPQQEVKNVLFTSKCTKTGE